jgi:PTH1 family peptidyl-tRNA hydrolase
VVVGLGNPGPAYADTRHSVGYRVVERLAAQLGGRFSLRAGAACADVQLDRVAVVLAKPLSPMNASGPVVARLLRDLSCGPGALILVHDDLDLPFGRVRVRHRGRDGGHRGVRSVIEALGTPEFRRVKVGVGRPGDRALVTDWLVATPWEPAEAEALPGLLALAVERVQGLLRSPEESADEAGARE